jgi:hypothetical protein
LPDDLLTPLAAYHATTSSNIPVNLDLSNFPLHGYQIRLADTLNPYVPMTGFALHHISPCTAILFQMTVKIGGRCAQTSLSVETVELEQHFISIV